MKRRLLCAIALCSGIVAAPALAEPVDAALQTKLLEIYDRFNAAVKRGDFRAAMATRDRASRLVIESQARTDDQRRTFVELSRILVPSRLEVRDGEVAGDTARLEAVASLLPRRQLGGSTGEGLVQERVSLEFRREGGFWKFVGSTSR